MGYKFTPELPVAARHAYLLQRNPQVYAGDSLAAEAASTGPGYVAEDVPADRVDVLAHVRASMMSTTKMHSSHHQPLKKNKPPTEHQQALVVANHIASFA